MHRLRERVVVGDAADPTARAHRGALPTVAPHVDLTGRLRQLGAEGATGRLDVIGPVGGRIYFDGGSIGCAEQYGHQTMLLCMADAGLFTPAEWTAALRVSTRDRWRVLVGEDDERLDRLIEFARLFTVEQLEAIVRGGTTSTSFVPGSTHSLGTLATWPLGDLLPEMPETDVSPAAPPDSPEPAPATAPASGSARASTIDRAEFLELLSEIYPDVAT